MLEIEMFWYIIVHKQKLYLYLNELFEIELFIWIKMDLALIIYKAIKPNQTETDGLLQNVSDCGKTYWSFLCRRIIE